MVPSANILSPDEKELIIRYRDACLKYKSIVLQQLEQISDQEFGPDTVVEATDKIKRIINSILSKLEEALKLANIIIEAECTNLEILDNMLTVVNNIKQIHSSNKDELERLQDIVDRGY